MGAIDSMSGGNSPKQSPTISPLGVVEEVSPPQNETRRSKSWPFDYLRGTIIPLSLALLLRILSVLPETWKSWTRCGSGHGSIQRLKQCC